MFRISSCFATAMLALASIADAQICLSNASFAEGSVRVGASGEFGQDAKIFGAELAFGAPSAFFASGGIGRVDIDEVDEGATNFSARIGYGIDVSPGGTAARTLEVCPIVGFGYLDGPNFDNPIIGQLELSSRSIGGGASIGGVLATTPTMSFVPSIGFVYLSEKFTVDDNGDETSETEDYGIVSISAGLVFNRTVTVRPGIQFPVGLDEADPVFGLALGLSFGRRSGG